MQPQVRDVWGCVWCGVAPPARTAWRMRLALPRVQSRRVCTTMSRMLAMPRPGSPTKYPMAREYSTCTDNVRVV